MESKNKKSEIGNFVRSFRKKLGMTQSDFAQFTGVGTRFINELENGKTTLRMDKVNQVLWVCGRQLGINDLPRIAEANE